jgi:alpha-tubulin suppressor-like RCC1 family protein
MGSSFRTVALGVTVLGSVGALVAFPACSVITSLDDLKGNGPAADGGGDAHVDAPGSDASPSDAGPDVVLPPSSAVDIAAGGILYPQRPSGHACAIVGQDRSVFCWGAGGDGQLGNGAQADKVTPTKIIADSASQAFTNVDQIALGAFSSCSRKGSFPYCWGLRQAGTVGDGTVSATPATAPKSGTGVVTQVAAGGLTSCALKADGLYCWGEATSFQLGANPNTFSACPSFFVANGYCSAAQFKNTKIGAIPSAVGVTIYNVCVIVAGGQVTCWGSNLFGVSGNDAPISISADSTPLTVKTALNTPLTGAAQIASGGQTVCIIASDKSVWCWGANDAGQAGQPLGDGGAGSPYAKKVAGVANVGQVSVGDHATCAVDGNANVMCWGDDTYGQLGDGAKAASTTPVFVKGPGGAGKLSGVTKVAVAYGFACALTSDKSVWCWGHNDHGQLGDGTTTDRPYPVRVVGLP